MLSWRWAWITRGLLHRFRAFTDYCPVMPVYTTQAILASADNISANFATNTWCIDALDLTELALAHTAISNFYFAADAYFTTLCRSTNGLELTSYNKADSTPRAPVLTNFYNLAPTGTTALPPEVSLCLSFQAAKASGLPQARRRGRIYLPYMDEANNDSSGRPSTAMVNGIVAAATTLLAASDAATGWGWAVYSTVTGTPAAITDGWVDNEWDTQRRRGRPATTRTTFT